MFFTFLNETFQGATLTFPSEKKDCEDQSRERWRPSAEPRRGRRERSARSPRVSAREQRAGRRSLSPARPRARKGLTALQPRSQLRRKPGKPKGAQPRLRSRGTRGPWGSPGREGEGAARPAVGRWKGARAAASSRSVRVDSGPRRAGPGKARAFGSVWHLPASAEESVDLRRI